MKTEKNILIAFILNISFSIIEIIGGFITNSVSIMSDAIHDFGDALSIGLSYFLEKKSKKEPDNKYTYGYIRYSILGAFITTCILTIGSIIVIYNACVRLLNPATINYDGMILFAIFGITVNLLAAWFTKEGKSLNQKAVNLHMLEDVLGWLVVLIGAIIMKFIDITILDSIMSIAVALFILINSVNNFKTIIDLFLEKAPNSISTEELKSHILAIEGILDVHHIHIWSIDGYNNYATMHVIVKKKSYSKIKTLVKEELKEHGISHVTIEIEDKDEECHDTCCKVDTKISIEHHHHHH